MVTLSEDSILDSMKHLLTGDHEDTSFDADLIIFINGAISALKQLGVGPEGYSIKNKDDTWSEFLGGRADLELVKTMIYLKVKLVFDPPQNAFLTKAIKEQLSELEWRIELNARSE